VKGVGANRVNLTKLPIDVDATASHVFLEGKTAVQVLCVHGRGRSFTAC